jgi:hypothetical protein
MRLTPTLMCATLISALAGCGGGNPPPPAKAAAKAPAAAPADAEAEVTVERAKLGPEDRALVESQEWCVVANDQRLGSMGPPLKLTVKDQPVFICCKGCQRRALADPDKTLAKLEELKTKKTAQTGGPAK